jgi:hypothetical protein
MTCPLRRKSTHRVYCRFDLPYGLVTSLGVKFWALLKGCEAGQDRSLPNFEHAPLRSFVLVNRSPLLPLNWASASPVCITGSVRNKSIEASCLASRPREYRAETRQETNLSARTEGRDSDEGDSVSHGG